MLDIQKVQGLFNKLLALADDPTPVPDFDPYWLSANKDVLDSFNNRLPKELEKCFLFVMLLANAGLIEIKEIE